MKANIICVLLFLLFSIKNTNGFLKCYVCSQTEDDADTHCLDSPGSSDSDILECDKKYCYVVRQDYKDPRGKLASILRTCLDKPIYTNEVIEDDTHRAYYRACKTDLCNGGNGRTDESTGDSGAFGDKGTIYVPGTGTNSGQVKNVVYVVNLISFVILYLLK